MIVAKCLLLFLPLLLVANAQGGGRLDFFGRPDFRRPRSSERPTISQVPDTPMPTEKITEYVTQTARTQLPSITPVRPTPGGPIPSETVPFRGRVWTRQVFQGSRPIATYTPNPRTESTPKVNEYSPAASIVSSTTEPVSVITPSIRYPYYDNHAHFTDPNNYNSRGRYAPTITHNNDEIPTSSIKIKTELPVTTEKIPEIITEKITPPAKDYSPVVSSTPTTTTTSTADPVGYTVAARTGVPFINSHITYNESLNNNLETRHSSQASIHLNKPTSELRTSPETFTTPRASFIPTRSSNLSTRRRASWTGCTCRPLTLCSCSKPSDTIPDDNSRTDLPPYMSHYLNAPAAGIPDDYLRRSLTTNAATTDLPSAKTESVRYTVSPSAKVPYYDNHKRYDVTTTTPVPFKVITTTEAPTPIYQGNQNNKINIARDSELVSPKATPPTESVKYIITTTTKAPVIDKHQEYHNGNIAPIYPVYHGGKRVSHYEQSSLSTRKPEGNTVATTTKVPFVDLHKTYDGGFTSRPAVEYTNGHSLTAEISSIKTPTDESKNIVSNIYQNNNHKVNNYEYSSTPRNFSTTQSGYKYRPAKPTTEQAVAQTLRHTNSYRITDMTTKPTTRYTTTTTTTTSKRPSRVYKSYDIENFKCKEQDAYYSITNQCDDFIECKSGYPIQNTCPDGLHFNPAAKYPEFPCAFPSQVKCESNSVIRAAEPTSSCPRRYGYFALRDGSCDKYIMCQEGLATIMSCPAGLAFSDTTSSCDWPANVPDCLPNAFLGFTCPAPELSEDGEATQRIYKYRYEKSCKMYIACQKGHPRLLSCDNGLAFDQISESCIDEFNVTDCT